MTGEPRARVVSRIAAHLIDQRDGRPLRVAIDGVTGAGKTTFAGELRAAIEARGVAAVKLSTDDFHHRSEHRHRDPDPARGYYRDAYDFAALRRLVLDPLGPAGSGSYVPRRHDLDSDEFVEEQAEVAARDAIVVVEGTFLQARELTGAWDQVVYVDTSFATAVERAIPRDVVLFGDAEAVRAAYRNRYHAACRLYLEELQPAFTASIVFDNNDIDRPVLTRLDWDRATTVT